MANNVINTKNSIMFNSIPEQHLLYANQLTLESWNSIINMLRTQANANANYLQTLHTWLLGNENKEYVIDTSFVQHVFNEITLLKEELNKKENIGSIKDGIVGETKLDQDLRYKVNSGIINSITSEDGIYNNHHGRHVNIAYNNDRNCKFFVPAGSSIIADARFPSSTDGLNGDIFINSDTGQMFLKHNNVWVLKGSLQGPQGIQGIQGEQGIQGVPGVPGIQGPNGETPYIEDDGYWWIGSTNTGVKAQGPQGLQGIQGPQGPNGDTPYIQDGNWWVGDTDTGVQAQGPQGPEGRIGMPGLQGPRGPQGSPGKNGDTPYIQDGNWWVGDTDTGVQAQGPQGGTGVTGPQGDTPYIGANDTWWVGDTDTGVQAQGPQGDTVTITNVTFDDLGCPTFTLSDGSTLTTPTSLRGVPGPKGDIPYIQNGTWWVGNEDTGVKAQGSDGETPHIGENGNWWVGALDTGVSAAGKDGSASIGEGTIKLNQLDPAVQKVILAGIDKELVETLEVVPPNSLGDELGNVYYLYADLDQIVEVGENWRKAYRMYVNKGFLGINMNIIKLQIRGKDGATIYYDSNYFLPDGTKELLSASEISENISNEITTLGEHWMGSNNYVDFYFGVTYLGSRFINEQIYKKYSLMILKKYDNTGVFEVSVDNSSIKGKELPDYYHADYLTTTFYVLPQQQLQHVRLRISCTHEVMEFKNNSEEYNAYQEIKDQIDQENSEGRAASEQKKYKIQKLEDLESFDNKEYSKIGIYNILIKNPIFFENEDRMIYVILKTEYRAVDPFIYLNREGYRVQSFEILHNGRKLLYKRDIYVAEDDAFVNYEDWEVVEYLGSDEIKQHPNTDITFNTVTDLIKQVIRGAFISNNSNGFINTRYYYSRKYEGITDSYKVFITDLITSKKYVSNEYKRAFIPSNIDNIQYTEEPYPIEISNLITTIEPFQFSYTNKNAKKEVILENADGWKIHQPYTLKCPVIVGTQQTVKTIEITATDMNDENHSIITTNDVTDINLQLYFPFQVKEVKAIFYATDIEGPDGTVTGSVKVGTLTLLKGTKEEYEFNSTIKISDKQLKDSGAVRNESIPLNGEYHEIQYLIYTIIFDKVLLPAIINEKYFVSGYPTYNNKMVLKILDLRTNQIIECTGTDNAGYSPNDLPENINDIVYTIQEQGYKEENKVLTEQIEMLQAQIDNLPVFSKEVASNSYSTQVPNNALDYCLIEEIGGMSYESENLIVLEDVEETTKNGVTYSVKNGVIIIVGQTGDNSVFVSPRLKNKIYLDGTYSINYFITKKSGDIEYCRCESSSGDLLFVSNNVSQSKKTSTLTNTNMVKLVIPVQENRTVDLELKPMLVKGDVIPTTYKQGYDGFKHTKVTNIKFEQNNLLKPQYLIGSDSNGNFIRDNYSLVLDEDGWYTYNKTSNSSATLTFLNTLTSSKPETYNNPLPIGTYSFRVVFKEGKFNDLGTFKINYDTTSSTDNSIIVIPTSSTLGYRAIEFYSNQPITKVYLYSSASLVVDNVKFKIELVKNNFISDNIIIPTEVQNLDGYGKGIDNDSYNYIGYDDVGYYFFKDVDSYTFTGSEELVEKTTIDGLYKYYVFEGLKDLIHGTDIKFKGEKLIRMPNELILDNYGRIYYESKDGVSVDDYGSICLLNKNIQTIEDMQTYLTGKSIIYKKSMPETNYNITILIPDDFYLQIQEKGTITFANENKKDVPNKVTYAIKVV